MWEGPALLVAKIPSLSIATAFGDPSHNKDTTVLQEQSAKPVIPTQKPGGLPVWVTCVRCTES